MVLLASGAAGYGFATGIGFAVLVCCDFCCIWGAGFGFGFAWWVLMMVYLLSWA